MEQHHDDKGKPHYNISPDHILVGGIVGDDAEEKSPSENKKTIKIPPFWKNYTIFDNFTQRKQILILDCGKEQGF